MANSANVGSVGVQLRADMNFNLSSNTSVSIILTAPGSNTDVGGAGTTAATAITGVTHDDIESSGQTSTFAASEYILFTTTVAFIEGRYVIQGKYVDGSKTLFSDKRTFEVR